MSAEHTAPLIGHQHLLSIRDLNPMDVTALLELANGYVTQNREVNKKSDALRGRTVINLFYEPSTRTQASFELAAKRLGADTVNMSVKTSSVSKGETLLDTAATLNAMNPDLLIIRHSASGAQRLLAKAVDCSVVNAGDGTNEHPSQALLDALTLHRKFGALSGLTVAICGDVLHGRVAKSNLYLLAMMGARVRLVAPPTLLPPDAERWGAEIFHDMDAGIKGADVVMMLRLQNERMEGTLLPSTREYARYYGLTHERLALAKPGAVVMHPGPMNRGVEIDGRVADDPNVSLILDQVEMGVAMRMAILDALSRHRPNDPERKL